MTCVHGQQERMVSLDVPCIRDAEQEVARTKWTRRALLSKVVVHFVSFDISSPKFSC